MGRRLSTLRSRAEKIGKHQGSFGEVHRLRMTKEGRSIQGFFGCKERSLGTTRLGLYLFGVCDGLLQGHRPPLLPGGREGFFS